MARRAKVHHSPMLNVRCPECSTLRTAEWDVLTEEEVRLLDAGKHCHRFAAGDYLHLQGEPSRGMFCLSSGFVGMSRSNRNGQAVMTGLVPAGSTLGVRSYFQGTAPNSARALVPTTACLVSRATLAGLLQSNPKLGLNFLVRLSHDLEEMLDRMLESEFLPVRIRLLKLLLTLRQWFGSGDPNRMAHLHLPFSREQIAELLSVRPETVSRAFSELVQEGLLELNQRDVTIPSLHAAREAAEHP